MRNNTMLQECSLYAIPGHISNTRSHIKFSVVGTGKEKRIVDAVCKELDTDLVLISRKSKKPEYTLPRQICFYFLHKYTDLTLLEMGNLFGGKHYTTVMYGAEMISDRMDVDKAFKKQIEELDEIIKTIN